MRVTHPSLGVGFRGSDPAPSGALDPLFSSLIVVHCAGDEWCVAAGGTGGHYEVIPLVFSSYEIARDWSVCFQLEASK